jgi:hypothetical protein
MPPEANKPLTMLIHHLTISKTVIDHLDAFFFEHQRPKRQVLAGLSLMSGIFSFGMSIYNKVEITKLHNSMNEGFDHVLHVLQDQDRAVTTLTQSVQSMQHVLKQILDGVKHEEAEISLLKMASILSTMIETHNEEVSRWGSGLDALLHGNLHPTFVDAAELQRALESIYTKAAKFGLRPLFKDNSAIFRSAVSFLSTEDKQIYVFVHVPFVDTEPLDLYEHLPIPFAVGDLLVTVQAPKSVLAVDVTGVTGLELSTADLLHCQAERIHSGNVFICPNSNLLLRNIRKTCLGSLLLGDSKTSVSVCQHVAEHVSHMSDFAVQVGLDKILTFSAGKNTAMEICSNGTQRFIPISNFTILSPSAGCKILTESFSFQPQLSVIQEARILDRPTVFRLDDVLATDDFVLRDFENAQLELSKIQTPKPRELSELKNWLHQSRQSFVHNTALLVVLGTALVISIVLAIILGSLYWSYRKGKTNTPS